MNWKYILISGDKIYRKESLLWLPTVRRDRLTVECDLAKTVTQVGYRIQVRIQGSLVTFRLEVQHPWVKLAFQTLPIHLGAKSHRTNSVNASQCTVAWLDFLCLQFLSLCLTVLETTKYLHTLLFTSFFHSPAYSIPTSVWSLTLVTLL